MITTVDDAQNGFRNELLPMALGRKSAASQSLLEAILALCAFHVAGPSDALHHKLRAVRFLNQSFQVEGSEAWDVQIAACMVLCVYGVFDTTDSNWLVHLRGARGLLKVLPKDSEKTSYNMNTKHMLSPFLRSWILYHDVLGNFSETASTIHGYEEPPLLQLPEHSHEKTIVSPSRSFYKQQKGEESSKLTFAFFWLCLRSSAPLAARKN